MEIRSFTICYCKQIAKNKKNEEAVLQQQFSSLHKLMCANPGQETVAKFYEVKLKLEQISMHKTEGAMIRSKARWCEQGERSTRYFFNLEKRNRSNNYITKLKAENRTLVNPPKSLTKNTGTTKTSTPPPAQTQTTHVSMRSLKARHFQN